MDLSYVSSRIQGAIERDTVRAAVVGIYENGSKSVLAHGVKSSEDPTVPDGDTTLEIGSITKVFTALLVQQLVAADQLDWDSPISSYLPGLKIKSALVRDITLRELATHSSGLPRLPTNMNPADALDPYADYDRRLLLAFVRDFVPEELKKEYAYSNLGFGLLGFIAAESVGLDYANAVSKYIFDDLGLEHSQAQYPESALKNLALGFSVGADMPRWNLDSLSGAGSILSTVNDLLRFIDYNFSNEAAGIGLSLKAIRKPQGRDDLALAWNIRMDQSGNAVYWHSGGTGGYASFLAMCPETSSGWVILTASTDYEWVTELGLSPLMPPIEDNKPDLTPYLGVFELMPNLYLTFSEEAGELHAQATGQPQFPLVSSGDNVFAFEQAQIKIKFEEFEKGRSQSIMYEQAGQSINAPRVDDHLGQTKRTEIELSVDELREYVGSYELAPNVIIAVQLRGQQLFAQLTGQPVQPIFPMEKDRFFFKVADAELKFERDSEQKIDELVIHQAGEHHAKRID